MNSFQEKLVLEHVARSLSAKVGAEVSILSNSPLGGGCINQTSELATSAGLFFLKWNADGPPDMFAREADSLRELAKPENPFLRIPRVILEKENGNVPGYLLLEYLEPLRSGAEAEENLGRGLAVIHRYFSNKFGFFADTYCGTTLQDNTWNGYWPDFFGQQRIWHLARLIEKKGNMPLPHLKIYEKLVLRIPDLLPARSLPVLIHGDLWNGNFMLTSKGPALIDPAVYYADREMEMGIMTLFGGFSARFWGAYNETNPLPDDWRQRNKLYQLYHLLNHFYLFGGGYGQQAFDVAKYYAGG